jgi:hypothetical protein
MNIEQLSTMAESDLQARANDHLVMLDNTFASGMEKEHHVAQAQVYLAELDRRKQALERVESGKIADRDYKLEKWVIGLIGAELVLAVVAIIFGWVEGNKQMEVLDKLNKSSAETAATLTSLRQAQEASLATQKTTLDNIVAMNTALRDQLEWNLADALQFVYGGKDGQAVFANRGRADLYVWGSKIDGQNLILQHQPTLITLGATYNLDVSSLSNGLFEKMQDNTRRDLPFELYLETANGKHYVAKSTLQLVRLNKDTMVITGRSVYISFKKW